MVARVLVVDDSRTMRTILSGALEQHPGIEIVGLAGSADEARSLIASHRPDILTLDVEMPGTDGISFLREIMREQPMPVVMVSALLDGNSGRVIDALRLGAIDCFAKPSTAFIERFRSAENEFATLVLKAAGVRAMGRVDESPLPKPFSGEFAWNGKIAGFVGGAGGVNALFRLVRGWPANGPPALVVQRLQGEFLPALVARLDAGSDARVVAAVDGAVVEPGHIYVAVDTAFHLVIEGWPDARLKLVRADPVNGSRPSADVMFRSLALNAKDQAIGAMLSGDVLDGIRGLKMIRSAGGMTFGQDGPSCMVNAATRAAVEAGAVASSGSPGQMLELILQLCDEGLPDVERVLLLHAASSAIGL